MHLRYNLYGSPNGHPQKVMKKMGITYQHATPQSIGDQWWFWNCENVPHVLPEYLSELELDPMECIGFGLSKENAERIRNYKSKTSKLVYWGRDTEIRKTIWFKRFLAWYYRRKLVRKMKRDGTWDKIDIFWSAAIGDVKGNFGKTNAKNMRPFRGF